MDINIRIVGLGEGGARAVSNMIAAGVGKNKSVSFVAIGKDENILLSSTSRENIFLNRDSTTIYKRISSALRGAKIILVVMGGGSGAAVQALPIVIACAKNNNASTVAFVNRPSVFESVERKKNCDFCLSVLHRDADTVFDYPTEKFFLLRLNQPQVSIVELLAVANDIFCRGADIFFELTGNAPVAWGNASFGYGYGANALDALKTAVKFPLLEQDELKRTQRIFIRVTSKKDKAAKNFITSMIRPDAELIWRADDNATGDKIFASIVFSKGV